MEFTRESKPARVVVSSGNGVTLSATEGWDAERRCSTPARLTLDHLREFLAECEARGLPGDAKVSVSAPMLGSGGTLRAFLPDEPAERDLEA